MPPNAHNLASRFNKPRHGIPSVFRQTECRCLPPPRSQQQHTNHEPLPILLTITLLTVSIDRADSKCRPSLHISKETTQHQLKVKTPSAPAYRRPAEKYGCSQRKSYQFPSVALAQMLPSRYPLRHYCSDTAVHPDHESQYSSVRIPASETLDLFPR